MSQLQKCPSPRKPIRPQPQPGTSHAPEMDSKENEPPNKISHFVDERVNFDIREFTETGKADELEAELSEFFELHKRNIK